MDRKTENLVDAPGSLTLKIFKFIIPLMLTGILQLLYNAADSVVVGRFESSDALAAVTSVGSLINLLVNLFMGLSVGTSVAVAHDWGAKDFEGVSRTIHTSYLISFIGGILVSAVGIAFSGQFLVWMKSDPAVLPLSARYLRIYFVGTTANMAYNFGASVLRSVGDTRRPLYFLAVSGLVNVILNLIFVIVFRMGVDGVAWATVASQVLSAAFVIVYMMRTDGPIRFEWKKLRVHPDKLKKIVLVGLPAGLQGTVFSISNVIIQSSVNSFGNVVMAGNGAAASIEGFTYIAMNSVYHASLTFVGQFVGARKLDRINGVIFRCLALVSAIGIFFGVLSYVFADPLLSIYLPNDPGAVEYGRTRLLYLAVPYFLCGMMEVMVGGQRGMGLSLLPMINALLGSCVLRIVWIVTIFAAHHTLFMLYISYPVSWLVTTAAHSVVYAIRLRKLKREDREPVF
ncbi:MAG: MATE family efflux transporter [Ruminococcaceae bacterium]|nr:MATE family efflux transporter [Oscillospiraceae bacterium]